eukprot:scaffold4487_cov273-Chaetoceros_neogracile.AAC.6
MDAEENTSRGTSPVNTSTSPIRGTTDLGGQDGCSNSNHTSTSSSKEEGTTSAADTSISSSRTGSAAAALSSCCSVSTKQNDDCRITSIVVVDEVVAATRIEAQGLREGPQGNKTEQQEEEEEQDAEQKPQAQSQQAQHHKYDTDIRPHVSNNPNHQTITSSYSTTGMPTTRSNNSYYDASSSYSRPRTRLFARRSTEEDIKCRVPNPLSPPPPADDSISTSAGITSTSTSAGVTFPGYPPSSLVTRSSNTNSSSSQQKKPSSPNEQEGAGQYYATKKRRRITLSTIQALRSCTTYVTRVKTSLLASNHDAEFDAFLELLCNWSDQGLTSEEVFSQIEVILQDVSPELLTAFITFLPGDTQEKAKLRIASSVSASRMPIRAAHEDEIQVVSATNDTKHLDSDNEDKLLEQGYPPA